LPVRYFRHLAAVPGQSVALRTEVGEVLAA